MTAQEFINLIEELEADYFILSRSDWRWLASHDTAKEARWEWYLNNGDTRNEALTAAERNR